jgi:hypothetical protein
MLASLVAKKAGSGAMIAEIGNESADGRVSRARENCSMGVGNKYCRDGVGVDGGIGSGGVDFQVLLP